MCSHILHLLKGRVYRAGLPKLVEFRNFLKNHRVSQDKCFEEDTLENNILMQPNLFPIK